MRTITALMMVFMFLSMFCLTNCQAPKTNPLKEKIKREAEIMSNSLVNKNYETFVKYMFPPLLEKMGGKENAINILKQGLDNGNTLERVKISYPSDTIMINNEIQCTLLETIELKVKGGKLIATSTLIGISDDNGNTWHFLDANSKGLKTLKNNFPNLSDRLVFKESSKPLYFKD